MRTLAVAIAGTLLLSGCGASVDLQPATADRLQAEVASIAESAAAGDPTNALMTAETLYTHVTAALEAGTMSPARADRIRAALDVVRADLTALLQATPEPEIQPEPEPEPVTTVDRPQDSPQQPSEPEKPKGPGPDSGGPKEKGPGQGPGKDKEKPALLTSGGGWGCVS